MDASGFPNEGEVARRLTAVLGEHSGPCRVDPEGDLLDELGMDSLGLVELLAAVEDEFEVEFERHEAEALRSFGDVVRAVEAKRVPA